MIDWQAHPIESGQGGDPWRIAVCALVRYKASSKAARRTLPTLFERWPEPADLMVAPTVEIAEILQGIALHHRKARQLKRLARDWFLGMIFPNKTIAKAVNQYSTNKSLLGKGI